MPDTSVLSSLIALAEQVNEALYTPSTVETLRTALNSAKELLEEAGKTQVQVNEQELKLRSAYEGLVRRVDTSSLRELLRQAAGYNQTGYTASSFEALRAAVTDAEAAIADAELTETGLASAVQRLSNAINGLVAVADNSALVALITQAENLLKDEAHYTSYSVEQLQAQLVVARGVCEKDDATRQELTDAQAALQLSMSGLVDLRPLRAAIEDGEAAINSGNSYTEESLLLLTNSLQTARTTVSTSNASAQEVQTAAAAVNTAVRNLVLVISDEISAPERALMNEPFRITVNLTSSYRNVYLFNESGKKIGILSSSKSSNGDNTVWSIETCLGTSGEKRVIYLSARNSSGEVVSTGLSVTLTIEKKADASSDVTIKSADFSVDSVKRNTKLSLEAVTSVNTFGVSVHNENGKSIGLSRVAKTVKNYSITYVYDFSIATAGTRVFSVYARDQFGNCRFEQPYIVPLKVI